MDLCQANCTVGKNIHDSIGLEADVDPSSKLSINQCAARLKRFQDSLHRNSLVIRLDDHQVVLVDQLDSVGEHLGEVFVLSRSEDYDGRPLCTGD